MRSPTPPLPGPRGPDPGTETERGNPPAVRFDPDGYGLLIKPSGGRPHECQVPNLDFGNAGSTEALWRCECGLYYTSRSGVWWQVTKRQARKMLRKARRQ